MERRKSIDNTYTKAQSRVIKMRKANLNIEQSKAVYNRCKGHIEPKHCYNNIFEVVTDYMEKFRSDNSKWKVCYGFTEVMLGVYCRHCFILDEIGEVIDPTIFTQSEPPLEREYYAMYVFDDVDEYLTAIEENDLMPALDKYLREKDNEAQKWAREQGIFFIG